MSNDSSEGKGETAGSGRHRIYGKEDRIVPGGGNEDAGKKSCVAGHNSCGAPAGCAIRG